MMRVAPVHSSYGPDPRKTPCGRWIRGGRAHWAPGTIAATGITCRRCIPALARFERRRAELDQLAVGAPIIFLDFDGVLNHVDFAKARTPLPAGYHGPPIDTPEWTRFRARRSFDPVCVERLNRIVDESGARVVVSSSWRSDGTREYLRDLLRAVGYRHDVIGRTPITDHQPRGEEIMAYLGALPGAPGPWVVLDDDPVTLVGDRLVQTSHEIGGLLDEHVDRAIRMLAA